MYSLEQTIYFLEQRQQTEDWNIRDQAIFYLKEYRDLKQATAQAINNITVNMTEVVHCKDCAHYEEDVFGFINNIPVIIAHHGCKAWGGPMGCKTDPEGWCHMGRRKDEKCSQNS